MNKKIKVLHVLQSSHFSGAENVVCKIIDIFRNDKNIEMAYCSRYGSISEVMKKNNIQYYPIEKLCISQLKKIVELYDPDIIHAHDANASVISSIIAKNRIVISHMHSNPPWMSKFSIKSILYLISSIRYKQIAAVSNSIIDEYIFANFIKKKIIMIDNPVDIEAIEKSVVCNNFNDKENDIVFIGRLVQAKNPIRFIKLVNKLKKHIPTIKATIIGEGELRSNCERLISELRLENNIVLTGFLENPYNILSASKVLCNTSEWEGYGLVAVEALALGIPVVCNNVGGLPELIDDECGKVCSSNIEFVDEIIKLLSEEEYRKLKVNKARDKAKLLDNIELYKQSIKRLYNS